MKLRFKILSPVALITDNYIICGLPNDLTDLAVSANTSVLIKYKDTEILNTTDINAVAFPIIASLPDNNFLVFEKNVTGTLVTFELGIFPIGTYPAAYTEMPLYVKIEKSGYETYENSFVFYDYDFGNDVDDTPPITNNVEVNFSLIEINASYDGTNQTLPYSDFVAFRRPFTDEVRFYNLTSSQGSYTYTDETGAVISTQKNGFFTRKETVVIKQSVDINGTVCDNELEVLEQTNIPVFDVNISVGIKCQEDNQEEDIEYISTAGQNYAEINLDISNLSAYNRNDNEYYANNWWALEYLLYDFQGNLVDSKLYNFDSFDVNYPLVFSSIDYRFNFQLTEEGDFILKTSLKQIGKIGDTLFEGDLIVDNYYQILTNSGSDFIPAGAATNDNGIVFAYNGEPFTWGSGSLVALDAIVTTSRYSKIKGCNRYAVQRSTCDGWKILNNSVENLIVAVYQMESDSSFSVVTGMSALSLPLLSSITVTFPTDNIYKIVLTDIDGNLSTFVIPSFCNLQTCFADTVKELVCTTSKKPTKDICAAVYDFNAFAITAFTYFNIINKDYDFNKIYDSLSPDDVKALYDLKTFLDKFKEYCGVCDNCGSTCATTCSTCS